MYVFGTNIGQNAKIQSVDSNTSMTVTVANAGTVSGTLNFAWGTESAEQECYTQGAAVTVTNLCLQSDDFSNASWTKTTVTVTANVDVAPTQVYWSTGAVTGVADRLLASGNNATVTQSITTTNGVQYTFSVYVRSDIANPQTSVAGSISFGSSSQNFQTNYDWQRISVTFTAVGASTTATITINNNGSSMIAASACVNTGSTPIPYVATTTTSVSQGALEPSSILVFSKGSSGENSNQGIVYTGSVPTGLWHEIYLGTSSGFTPTVINRTINHMSVSTIMHTLTNSNGNVFRNLTEIGGGLVAGIISLTTCSDNQFIGYDIGLDYANSATSSILVLSNLCNNNFIYDWDVKNIFNATATIYPFGGASGTTNNNSGLILQNIRSNSYALPLNNNYINTICKGVVGGSFSPLTGTATTSTMVTTTDGVANAYTTIYDTIFNELYIFYL
jgi:hypothetical protein